MHPGASLAVAGVPHAGASKGAWLCAKDEVRVPASKAPARRSVASCGFGLKKAAEGKEGKEAGIARQEYRADPPTGQQSWTLSATEAGFCFGRRSVMEC